MPVNNTQIIVNNGNVQTIITTPSPVVTITSGNGGGSGSAIVVNPFSLLGNETAAPSAPRNITLGTGLTFVGTTLVNTGSGGGSALTETDDTNVTLTLTGTPTTALAAPVNIAVGWLGTLAYSRFVNGAGLSVVGRSVNSAGVQADITAGTDGFVLRRSGVTLGFGTIGNSSISDLAWGKITSTPTTLAGYGITDGQSNSLITSHILVGNAFNIATDVAMSGDITINNTGVTAIGANKVLTTNILNSNVTYAKIQNVTDGRLLGNATGGAAAPSEITVSNGLTLATSSLKWGGSLANATNITGTTTNTITYQFDGLAVSPVDGAGLLLLNNTAALLGAQQESPSLTFEGSGWGTTSSIPYDLRFRIRMSPLQATTNAIPRLIIDSKIAGNAYNNCLVIQDRQSWVVTVATFDIQNSTNQATLQNSLADFRIRGGNASGTSNLVFSTVFANNTNNTIAFQFTDQVYANASGVTTRTNTGVSLNYTVQATLSGVGSTVNHTALSIIPIFSLSGSTLNMVGINYNPAITATIGTHYGLLIQQGLSGFGTATPVSGVEIATSWGRIGTTAAAALTSTTTLNNTHNIVLANATSGSFTINLPAAASNTWRTYTVKKINATNTVTLDGNAAETIDGAATYAITAQWTTITIWCDGSNWYVIGN